AAIRSSVRSPLAVRFGDTTNMLVDACNSIARSTLLRVCRKTQVKRTDFASISTKNSQMGC
ncbi:MAG TPA: hypothetical protein VFI90_02900, partial [Rubrobacter sp.]|nr:hypothetical protein [Rubrobacter sp.]